MFDIFGIFEQFKKNRQDKEVIRLELLLEKEEDEMNAHSIKMQISLCKALSWRDYTRFCRYF